jgi:Flp pilus assembly protein TadG
MTSRRSQTHRLSIYHSRHVAKRRGAIAVLMAFFLMATIGFIALGVEIGYVAYEKQEMQNACDAAALAAAMEITHAIENASEDVGDAAIYAQEQARLMAVKVADMNGHYIDGDRDVQFGRRSFNEISGQFEIAWDDTPSNVCRVTVRRDNPDATQPDARVQTFFAKVLGNEAPDLVISAIATVESRDIVSVLDFSRSMNFDSYFNSEASTRPSDEAIEANLQKVWEDLGSPSYGNMPFEPDWVTVPSNTWGAAVLTVRWESEAVYVTCSGSLNRIILRFSDGSSQTINTSTQTGLWQGTGSNSGKRINRVDIRRSSTTEQFDFYSNSVIKRGLGLTGVAYPWPSGSWDNYISMARDTSGSYYDAEIYDAGYRRKFGIMTFLHYVLRFEASHERTPDLWQTRHYPFHAMKLGQMLLCDYLEDLSFNDFIGMVSYDQSHRVEQVLDEEGMPSVDISAEPVTNNYQAISDLIEHKQAGHYSYSTNMGGGLKEAKLLLDAHGRPGARPTILLITDGNANTLDSGENGNLPSDWDWDELFDYDGDGTADYTSSNTYAKNVLKKAKECVDAGYTIHSMSVGADADTALLAAVAHLGGGIYLQVPASATAEEMEANMMEAFRQIAALVPPAQLLNPNHN